MPDSVQETLKLLKRLGFPESQDPTKASSLLTKVVQSLTKRMGKLQEVKDQLMKPEISESQLAKKSLGCVFRLSCFENVLIVFQLCVLYRYLYDIMSWVYPAYLRMVTKVTEVYNKIDRMAEDLQAEYDSGVVDGYTAESRPYSVKR